MHYKSFFVESLCLKIHKENKKEDKISSESLKQI